MMQRAWWLLIGLVMVAVMYLLPWYTHDTAGFTTSAYDLAEWASIHPAVRSSSPPMLTSLLLRLPQVALIAALALTANRFQDARVRWIVRAGALVLMLRFVPPSDFFSGASDDPNYRQMAGLAVLSVVSVLAAAAMFCLAQQWQDVAFVGVLLTGVITGWMGLSDVGTLLDNFEIDVSIGPGIIGYTVCAVVVLVITLWPQPDTCHRSGLTVFSESA